MRAQTALEFMLIMGAVVGLAAVAIGVYISIQKGNTTSINEMLKSTTTVAANTGIVLLPNFYLYLPAAFKVGSAGSAMLVVSWPGSFVVDGLNLSAENASVISQGSKSESSNGTYLGYFEIVPTEQGKVKMSVRGVIHYANTTKNFSESAVSFATYPSRHNRTAYGISATILQHNSSAFFGSVPSGSIYTISTSTHCAYSNWEGHLYKIVAQCGAGASWYYYVGSAECYYGAGSQYRAYCLYKSDIGTSYMTNRNGTYNYSITLLLQNNQTLLRSNLSSAESTNQIYSNGRDFGNATVSGTVYGNSTPPRYTIKAQGGAYSQVPEKDYSTFDSYLNNTLATLAYYNGSKISGASSDIAAEQIGKYNSEAESLLSNNAGMGNCTMVGSVPGPEYLCKVDGVISFSNITARLDGYYGNMTVDYGKSVINIR